MPGINPATYLTDLTSAALDLASNTATAPAVKAEPPLACYVTASCAAGAAATATSPKAKKCKRKRGHRATASRRRCKKGHKHR